MAELKFEITERIGVLSENANGIQTTAEWARVSLLLTKKWKLSRLFSTVRR